MFEWSVAACLGSYCSTWTLQVLKYLCYLFIALLLGTSVIITTKIYQIWYICVVSHCPTENIEILETGQSGMHVDLVFYYDQSQRVKVSCLHLSVKSWVSEKKTSWQEVCALFIWRIAFSAFFYYKEEWRDWKVKARSNLLSKPTRKVNQPSE